MTPMAHILPMLHGALLSQVLAVAAELDLARLVREGPRTVTELAESTGADPDALHRMLRALASVGVFTQVAPRVYGPTALSDTLTDHDGNGSVRALARLIGSAETHRTMAELAYSVRTGRPAFDRVHGQDWWTYLAAHSELAEIFHAAMGEATRPVEHATAEVCDLAGVRTLVDVGGGHGSLVALLLRRHPGMTAVVFDRPEVVRGASRALAEAGVEDRARPVGGDFFEAVPPDADAYVLSRILHDWSDDEAVRILTNVRKAMAPQGRVVVIDAVLPEGDAPHPGKLLDIVMLAQHTGRERTQADFTALFEAAGLVHAETRDIPYAPVNLLVAIPG